MQLPSVVFCFWNSNVQNNLKWLGVESCDYKNSTNNWHNWAHFYFLRFLHLSFTFCLLHFVFFVTFWPCVCRACSLTVCGILYPPNIVHCARLDSSGLPRHVVFDYRQWLSGCWTQSCAMVTLRAKLTGNVIFQYYIQTHLVTSRTECIPPGSACSKETNSQIMHVQLWKESKISNSNVTWKCSKSRRDGLINMLAI